MAEEKKVTAKTPRHRSPSYPSFSLAEAEAKARLFEEKMRRASVAIEIAMQTLGYKKNNSDGFRAIATLTNYGLLESEGSGANRKLRLSPLGARIVTDRRPASPEREAAIQEAALNPEIHKKLWEKHKYSGIPDDAVIKHELEHEHNFNRDVLSLVAGVYKETLKYAKLVDDAWNPVGSITDAGESDSGSDSDGKNYGGGVGGRKSSRMQGTLNPTMRDYPIPLDDKREAILSLPSHFTNDDIEALSDWVQLFAKRLISKPQEMPDEENVDGD